ncbi:MAG: hypothetical protein KAQ85_00155 [Thermodesulfovibrionia bacterium]|nr:hypothetical protein [Thermodesulfovibrionia bacterium]
MAGILTIVFAPMVNQTTDIVNDEISDGELSTTYAMWFNLVVGLAKAIPIFALIGVAGWAIVRALEKRNSEGA